MLYVWNTFGPIPRYKTVTQMIMIIPPHQINISVNPHISGSVQVLRQPYQEFSSAFLNPTFFRTKFFDPKFFFTQSFSGHKIFFGQKVFWTKILVYLYFVGPIKFLDLNFFTKIFFDTKLFWSQNLIWTYYIFFNPNLF